MRRVISSRLSVTVSLAVSLAGNVLAQSSPSERFLDNCRRNRSDYEQFCETRNVAVAAVRSLVVDGRENGGITVHAWDKAEIQVVAMVQAHAESANEAQNIARQIAVSSSNGNIVRTARRTNGQRNESWAVSFEIRAPRQTELALTASNGGISVDGIQCAHEFGDGEWRFDRHRRRWRRPRLDGQRRHHRRAERRSLARKRSGSADVERRRASLCPFQLFGALKTGTTNGGMDVGFPVTVQGSFGRSFTTQLGTGGATIRAVTTNGGVSIRRR